jgi:hypothetical protein
MMANMLDDAVSAMVTGLLDVAGVSYTYSRGTASASVIMRKSDRPSEYIDAQGAMVSTTSPDFITSPGLLPVDEPRQGDQITDGTSTWIVNNTAGEKPFRIINPSMIRIHTKRIV